ncbi:MAG TPA: gamma-glutamyltransferase [Ferrovibrio sp.]|jgi:gamma-glutamyltranspeptidase/glutathione hydrolase|uniref:gamma-glutamyltransferase n=1 Tax=Ferrovibrio sp. TaxID=1917215 RepID=UPI002B4AE883|nr:gamma-glutamyltransferase [Ferrovibrio sp.]HLT75972.1 gamma-glutamyltransferase [Ferrovibrio sp.]
MLRLFAGFALLVWANTPLAQTAPAPEAASGRETKSAVHAERQIVAAAHPLAAQAGIAILRKGGSALDAAIAVQMMLNLVEPQSSGIGGGAFILYWDAGQQRLYAYDGRETAPAAATPDRFLTADGRPMPFREAVASGRSVGVPGLLRALELAHRAHGRLSWAELFAPAITRAEQGFAVSPRLHKLLDGDPALRHDPAARALYYNADGSALAVGTLLRNPALAETFRQIAAGGPDTFYDGPLAEAMVAAVRNHPRLPGDLSLADFSGYRALAREPLCGRIRLFTICGFPPPSSGGIATLQILGILEALGPAQPGPVSPTDIHNYAEAGRLAFADRDVYVADADFIAVPVQGLIDKAYLQARARLIRAGESMDRAVPGEPPGRRGLAPPFGNGPIEAGTSHISIIDADGNAVAMTSSIESAFGARIMVGGFLLNNQLTDFSFRPVVGGRAVANRVEAHKRPRSSMAPTILFDAGGRLYGTLGSPGGSAIINYVARSIWLVLDKGYDLQAAFDLPHFGSRNGPTELEAGAPVDWHMALQAMGHDVRTLEMTSGLHGIVRGPRGWIGAADPRREGIAVGE